MFNKYYTWNYVKYCKKVQFSKSYFQAFKLNLSTGQCRIHWNTGYIYTLHGVAARNNTSILLTSKVTCQDEKSSTKESTTL
jgi:hypothetical protein